jgi:hypothetical protein
MARNEYSFDASGASNGAVFTLVEGTFAFVAGQVAHTGVGMRIATPVATMGIRGTVGLFKSEPAVINANLGHVWSLFLHEDLDGSHHLGRIAIIDPDPTSPTYGQVIYLLDSSEYIAYLEPQGPGVPPNVRLEPITNSRLFGDRHFYDDLSQILSSFNGTNPQSAPGAPGSGDNPNFLLLPQQLLQEDGGQPFFAHVPSSGGLPPLPTSTVGGPPVMPGQLPSTHTNNGPPSTIFIWNSNNPASWSHQLIDWNGGAAPNLPTIPLSFSPARQITTLAATRRSGFWK